MIDWQVGLRRVQDDVDNWTRQYTPQYWPAKEIATRLAEEVGELALYVNHLHGTKKGRDLTDDDARKELALELGDIVFTVACLANSHSIDLETALSEQQAPTSP